MSDENAQIQEKLDRIEAAISSLTSSTRAIFDRIDLLHQEFGRSASQLQRLGLSQESAKIAAQRRDQSLAKITEELAAIRSALENAQK